MLDREALLALAAEHVADVLAGTCQSSCASVTVVDGTGTGSELDERMSQTLPVHQPSRDGVLDCRRCYVLAS